MANYCCAVRTNYFHVKDPDAFKKFMKKVIACEGCISVWEEKDEAGKSVFGFGGYGSILGVPVHEEECNEDDDYGYDDCDFDKFVNGLSELVADDDAIIILESGNEKLRYVTGCALVITSKDSEYMEIDVLAAKRAAEMLKNPKWKTQVSY